jgi:hypothetical protein
MAVVARMILSLGWLRFHVSASAPLGVDHLHQGPEDLDRGMW